MKDLYTYLIDHIDAMGEDWMKTIDGADSTFYSTETSESIKEELRTSHRRLVEKILRVFLEESDIYKANIREYAVAISKKRASDLVPILESVDQINTVKKIVNNYIREFAELFPEKVTVSVMFNWSELINIAFDNFTRIFIEYYDKFKHQQLSAQQATIYELSSPIIPITKGIGILPLIGDIDTQRAHVIMESTLKQCNEKAITKLVIDLSGVAIIDTMVAHQIFQVIHALNLIGVEAFLAGVRPEVAQTAIQLGVDFSKIPIVNNLSSALAKIGLKVKEI